MPNSCTLSVCPPLSQIFRWGFFGNKQSYWRFTGVKTTRFLRALLISAWVTEAEPILLVFIYCFIYTLTCSSHSKIYICLNSYLLVEMFSRFCRKCVCQKMEMESLILWWKRICNLCGSWFMVPLDSNQPPFCRVGKEEIGAMEQIHQQNSIDGFPP